jgi:hypothetical protein
LGVGIGTYVATTFDQRVTARRYTTDPPLRVGISTIRCRLELRDLVVTVRRFGFDLDLQPPR